MIAKKPEQGTVKTIDGYERRYTDGYWIRHYPPHEKTDLHAALRMVNSFEWRFRKAVEGGMEANTDEASIKKLRIRMEAAKLTADAIDDKNSMKYKRARAEEEAYGSMLCVSMFRKSISDIGDHIRSRMRKTSEGEDTAHLEKLKRTIDKELREVNDLFGYLRRAGGEKDKDQVLAEMFGEPIKVLITTLGGDESMQQLYNNRYRKISACWKNIDDSTAAIKKLIDKNKKLKYSGLMELVDDLCSAAKSRCELQRHDPNFDEAASKLRSSRNLIKEFEPDEEGHAAKTTRTADDKVLALVQRYRKLVYDIAHVRTPRYVSTQELLQDIEQALTPRGRSH